MNLSKSFVLLPVPVQLATQVAQYAEALANGSSTLDREHGDTEFVQVPGQGPWSCSMVARVAETVRYEGVIALLDHCALKPGRWVHKAEAEATASVSPIQLRNELGAFSKTTRKLFGTVTWPMEWKKENGSYSYRLDPTVARWWTNARAETVR